MEGHIGFHHGADVLSLQCNAPLLKDRFGDAGPPGCCKLSGECVNGTANLIELAHLNWVDRRDDKATPYRIAQQPVLLQKSQCQQDGRAGHVEYFRQFLLLDPDPGCEPAIGDGIQQLLVHLIDVVGLIRNSGEVHGYRLDSLAGWSVRIHEQTNLRVSDVQHK